LNLSICMRTGQPVERASDRELLEQFVQEGSESAFTSLIERHGPLIFALCRRLLPTRQDAEDVFQATFLLLARKARLIRKPASLGSWLYGVAFRLAVRLNQQTARRKGKEIRAIAMRSTNPTTEITWRELCWGLDEEIHQLPEKFRTPLLLCYWEGLTQEEAARQLGIPRGTLKRRVEKARNTLRSRLTRRGITMSAALLVAMLAPNANAKCVSRALLRKTVAGASMAAGHGAAALGAELAFATLTKALLHTAVLGKMKFCLVLALALGVIASGNKIVSSFPSETIPATVASETSASVSLPVSAGGSTQKSELPPVWITQTARNVSQEQAGLLRRPIACAPAQT
jgi:RNA polymerase sigma factor (sigma-70 family)